MKKVADKLLLREGQTVLALNLPSADALGEIPSPAVLDREPADRIPVYDVIILFSRTRAELETLLDTAASRYRKGGILWICYPKQSSNRAGDLNRNQLWNCLEGFRPVTNISVDAIWTALRFRREEEVGD